MKLRRVRMTGAGLLTACVFSASVAAKADNIFVTDSVYGTITEFDSSGNRSVFGSVPSGLNVGASGLAFDSSGNLYVVSDSSGSIVKFDAKGNPSTFATKAGGEALAIDSGGNVYAADPGSGGRVVKFDSAGNSSVFASGLVDAEGLAFDGTGNLYVSDRYGGRILRFDPSGNGGVFASGFGIGPVGLAFDSNGNLFAAGGSTVMKFDPSGHGSVFATVSGFHNFWGIAFDSKGNLYVADTLSGGNNAILKVGAGGYAAVFASLAYPLFIAVQPVYTITTTAAPTAGGSTSGSGTFTAGSTVTVLAAPHSGYVFVNWTANGAPVSTSASYTFTVTASRTLTANFAPLYQVSTSASPAAGGSVSGGGTFVSGSSVTVTATASPGHAFVNWTENGVPVSASANYTFTVTANRTLTANFAPLYTITTAASPPAGGVTSGGGSYVSGSIVTLAAAPSAGYGFVNWTENGVQVSTSTSCVIAANANRTLIANFALLYTVAVGGSPTAGGSALGGGTFLSGSSVKVLAAPNPGFAFVNWTENAVPVSTSASYAFTVTANRTLTANFAPLYTVVANALPPAGGSVSGGGSFIAGSSVNVLAAPNAGFAFVNWTENGVPVSASANYTFTVTANRTLTANFAPLYTVTTSASPTAGGSISGGGAYTNGAVVLLTATANLGFHFLDWTENGMVLSSSNSFSFALAANRDLVANFATNLTDTIIVAASPSAGGRVSGGGTFRAGSSRTVTASPSPGYIFANWTENGAHVSASVTYTFTLRSDRNLVANFIPNPFPAVSGTYNGLFGDEANGVSPQSCGCFTITVAAKGAYSGSLQVGGDRHSLTGQFDFTGGASETVARPNAAALTVNMKLDLTNGTDRVTGSVGDGTWIATLAGDRAIYDGTTKLAPEAGRYTMIIAGASGSTNQPGGDSYGTLTVGKNGAISFTGTLADGTKITPGVSVSKYGQWPLYASLYGGQGVLWSWLTFTNASAFGGPVAWVKLPVKTQYYPAGFSLTTEAFGQRYFPPGRGTNVLGLTISTNLTLTLDGGGLMESITNRITLATNNLATILGGPKLTLTFTPSTGAFSGSVVNPAASKPVSFGGVLLQGPGFGSGFFLGPSGSGAVRLEP